MAVVFAYGMWRFVEEPAREWLRSKIGVRTEPAGEEQFVGAHESTTSRDSVTTEGPDATDKPDTSPEPTR